MLLQTKNGQFQLLQQGNQVLISFLFMKSKTTINVADFQNKTIVLLESSNTLDAVVTVLWKQVIKQEWQS
jgi:hypothetical protein